MPPPPSTRTVPRALSPLRPGSGTCHKESLHSVPAQRPRTASPHSPCTARAQRPGTAGRAQTAAVHSRRAQGTAQRPSTHVAPRLPDHQLPGAQAGFRLRPDRRASQPGVLSQLMANAADERRRVTETSGRSWDRAAEPHPWTAPVEPHPRETTPVGLHPRGIAPGKPRPSDCTLGTTSLDRAPRTENACPRYRCWSPSEGCPVYCPGGERAPMWRSAPLRRDCR